MNGCNVELLASFVRDDKTPNAYNDGIHKFGNDYRRTTSNLPSSINDLYIMPMTSDAYDIIDFENSYWHYRFMLTIDFNTNAKFMVPCQVDKEIPSIAAGDNDDIIQNAPTGSSGYYDSQFTRYATTNNVSFSNAKEFLLGNGILACFSGVSKNGEPYIQFSVMNEELATEDDVLLATTYLKSQFVFVGLKCSNQMIDDYMMIFNNADSTASRQIYALTEGYVYGNMLGKEETYNKRNVYTQYKEVNDMKNSVCGVYISMYDIIMGTKFNENTRAREGNNSAGVVSIPLDIIVPFTDLLSTQAFTIYPRCVFGDLAIQKRFTTAGMVHCQVDTIDALHKQIKTNASGRNLGGISDVGYLNDFTFKYDTFFHQMGDSGYYNIILGWDDAHDTVIDENGHDYMYSKILNMGHVELAPIIKDCRVVQAWSDIQGWCIDTNAKAKLTGGSAPIFSNERPFVIPAQSIDYRQFEQKAGAQGFVGNVVSMPLINCTDIAILYPTTTNARTCFRQIQAMNYQLIVNNQKKPIMPQDTLDEDFYQHQMQNTDFCAFQEAARDEYEDSITSPLTITNNTNELEYLYRPLSDNTDFMPIVKLQRPSAGENLWFDGITERYSSIMIMGNPSINAYENNGFARAAENNPYFSSKLFIQPDGRISTNSVNTEVEHKTETKFSPICVPIQQCYHIFRVNPSAGFGRPVLTYQFVKHTTFEKAFKDPTIDGQMYS